jgi:hypothetical protein
MFSHVSRRDGRFSGLLGVFALLIPLSMGCGGGKGKVSGTVTVDGQPLPAGTITFYPSKGTAVPGNISDGQYSVSGVPSGTAKITVETASIKKQADSMQSSTSNMQMSMGQMPPGAQMPPEAKARLDEEKKRADDSVRQAKELRAKYRPIPDKYAQPDTSGLTVEVKSGTNTHDVPLTSK